MQLEFEVSNFVRCNKRQFLSQVLPLIETTTKHIALGLSRLRTTVTEWLAGAQNATLAHIKVIGDRGGGLTTWISKGSRLQQANGKNDKPISLDVS